MWEYYVGIYMGLHFMCVIFACLGVIVFMSGTETNNNMSVLSGLMTFLFSVVFLAFSPGMDFAKIRACDVEKVEYICKEMKK